MFFEAEKNNPELKNARLKIQLSRISYKTALLKFAPEFSGNVAVRRSDDTSYSYGLGGKLSLFSGTRDVAEIKLRKTAVTREEASYGRTLADFVYNLRILFAKVLLSQMTISLYEEIQSRRKNNMELVELRYEAGFEDKGAKLRSEADYFQAKYETESEKRNYKIVFAELMKYIGKDDYEIMAVTGTFARELSEEIKNPNLKKLLTETPDYAMAKCELKTAAFSVRQSAGNLYPSINLNASLSGDGSQWPPGESSKNIGITLSYPFFTSGKDLYKIKSEKINMKIAENNFENTKREILFELQKARNKLVDSIQYLFVKEKYRNAMSERAKIARKKYLNGLIDYQEWDAIENDFINAEKALLGAKFAVFETRATWIKKLGRGE
ncbi:MAG: TolC family protein [Elusimicrobia bacterium]|nr:TolC family protein [Elusimicrobiota bacterium]